MGKGELRPGNVGYVWKLLERVPSVIGVLVVGKLLAFSLFKIRVDPRQSRSQEQEFKRR
jgi:hypothetical protein